MDRLVQAVSSVLQVKEILPYPFLQGQVVKNTLERERSFMDRLVQAVSSVLQVKEILPYPFNTRTGRQIYTRERERSFMDRLVQAVFSVLQVKKNNTLSLDGLRDLCAERLWFISQPCSWTTFCTDNKSTELLAPIENCLISWIYADGVEPWNLFREANQAARKIW